MLAEAWGCGSFLSCDCDGAYVLPLLLCDPLRWTPKGQLVAHIHEHREAVNRYTHSQITTCMPPCASSTSPWTMFVGQMHIART